MLELHTKKTHTPPTGVNESRKTVRANDNFYCSCRNSMLMIVSKAYFCVCENRLAGHSHIISHRTEPNFFLNE